MVRPKHRPTYWRRAFEYCVPAICRRDGAHRVSLDRSVSHWNMTIRSLVIANEPELTLSPHEWVDRERQSLQEKPSIQRNSFEVNALGGIVNRSLARHGISFRYL